ncbi:hypothetical protein GPX89_36560 [Nocardia sp. ET3-3]|uniref:Uncharacterized protein n=1 Tax=Nocardia terrae TaxID=2675851 RepID=A0A7K1V7V1_9NOCA|nr:hypothetical protein [Nocardia terrae]MVU82734.1 hypothetical protein [Nocardia terrae]
MRRGAGVLIGGLLAAVLAGCSATPHPADSAPAAAPVAAPRSAEPPAATASIAPGEVRLTPGPFTDRVRVRDTRVDVSSVHGVLTITSDVSDVLALEVHAAFYDATGHLVATGTFEQAAEQSLTPGAHTPGEEGIPFTITAAPAEATTTSAVLTIPVLVNE